MHSLTRRRSRLLALVASAAVGVLTLAGCSGGGTDASETDDELSVVVEVAPVSLDPALQNVDPRNKWFIELAYEPLIRLTTEDEYAPALAESWEYLDEESTQFELTLREDAQFNDGTDVTAEDVVASLEYMISSGVNGSAWLGADTTVEATSDTTVLITTAEPNSQMPYLLSQRTYLGSVISADGLSDPEALKSASYGAGPYMLDTDATIPDDTYVYVQNPNYYDPDAQHWDTIEIKVSGSFAASLQAVQNGDADMMRADVTTASSAEDAGLTVSAVSLGLWGVGYLDREGEITPEFADVRVRQALSYAIDRESIAEVMWGDYGASGNGITLPGFVGFTEEAQDSYSYDPEKAKELLAEAGYADGFSFDMATPNTSNAETFAQAIVENWAAIGVTANLTVYSDTTQLISDTLDKQYAVGVYSYGVQPQILQAKSFFTGGTTQYNPFDSYDEEIFEQLAIGDASSDPDVQQEAYAAALDRAVIDLAWFSNVGYSPSPVVYDADAVTGMEYGSLVGSSDLATMVRPAD